MKAETKRMIYGLIPALYIGLSIIWMMLGLNDLVVYSTDFLITFWIFGFILIVICWTLSMVSICDSP